MRPSSRSQSAATTALRKVHGELFTGLREIPHCSLVDFGALSTPYRCKFNRQNTWRPALCPSPTATRDSRVSCVASTRQPHHVARVSCVLCGLEPYAHSAQLSTFL